MKKIPLLLLCILIILVGLAIKYWPQIQGLRPAIGGPAGNIVELLATSPQPGTNANMPLHLPSGFSISILAQDLPNARVMTLDRFGNMWISQPDQGTVTSLEIQNGQVKNRGVVFRNLQRPHGLAIDPKQGTMLYVAEETKISRVALYSEDSLHKIADLPPGGRHTTRTLGFGPDSRLYVSIGSTCDVCQEKDERHAAIYSMNPDGSDFKKVASGLRNSVFFTWNPSDNRMWATEMGRDMLGDNTPSDEINIIEEGKNYGWPFCYGQKIQDVKFDASAAARVRCEQSVPPHIEIPAHSAPLGLAFIPEEGWPKEYQHNLLVAYHGSWNRSTPTGYKVVRAKIDEKGNFQGFEDFITGWLKGNQALGRPVDILAEPSGLIYISDDKAGVIYKIEYTGS